MRCAGKAGSGLFRVAAQQLGWKCTEQNLPAAEVVLTGAEIAAAEWQPSCGRGGGLLKISLKSGEEAVRFAGFKPEALAPLRAHFRAQYGVALGEAKVATEGWNWGDLKLPDTDTTVRELRFDVNGKLGLDIPYADVQQASTVKTDLVLALKDEWEGDEMLAEIRFHIPAGSDFSAEDACARLHQGEAAEVIASVPEVTVVAPRGKHDFDFLAEAMRIRGKTQTYTVKYRRVCRLFLLELGSYRPGGARWAILLGLDPPFQHGNQTQQFVCLLFDDSKIAVELPPEMSKKLSMSKGEEHERYSLFGKLVMELTKKSLVGAPTAFKERHPGKESCVVCNHKSQRGSLFLLKKSLIFVTKPVVWHPYDKVRSVSNESLLAAGGSRARTFDLHVRLDDGQTLEFAQIDRPLWQLVFEFCKEVGLKIENREEHEQLLQAPGAEGVTQRGRRTSVGAAAAAARMAAAAAVPDDGAYNEEEDEDFDDDWGDGEGSDDGSVEEEEEEVEDEPKKKRAKRK